MKVKSARVKQPVPREFLVPIKQGKVVWPKKRKPHSPEATRNMEADELIAALADAALAIGARGIVDNYSKYDFHLYPRHIADLLRNDHPRHSVYSAMGKSSMGRVIVPWPWREGLEPKTTNELRENPFEIIGLLMRKILDADSAFFEALAEAVRVAKIEAKQAVSAKDSSFRLRGKTRAGMIVADRPTFGMMGDPDWFTRIPKPVRKSKVPHAVWSLCESRYNSRLAPPKRRDIRDYLKANGIVCANLRAVLSRMNLEWLEEGKRPRNRSK